MSMQDPISDMLTRIRNAQARAFPTVSFPDSKIKRAILAVLEAEGYIVRVERLESGAKRDLRVHLKYWEGKPVMVWIKTISKPSMRVYRKARVLPEVRNGLGIAVVSTHAGVMTAANARALGHGGEVLCEIA